MAEIKDSNELQLVVFKLGDEEYGVEIMQVQEIIRVMETTRVPKAPNYIRGVINLRGKVIPVIDLKKRFSLAESEVDDQTRIMVVEVQEYTVGMIVDCVSEVLRLSSDSIEPTPPAFSNLSNDYIRGVGKLEDRLLILLDLDKTLTVSEMSDLEKVS